MQPKYGWKILSTTMLAAFAMVSVAGCGSAEEATGEDDSAIIGGKTDTGDPAVLALFAHQPGAQSGSLCTASLISPTVLLHAAHCVDPREVGDGNVFVAIEGTSLNKATGVHDVTSTSFDPQFDPANLQNGHDIGVSILAQPITTITPLPFNRAPLSRNLIGQSVRLIGYGVNVQGPVQTGAGTKRTVTTKLDDVSDQLLRIGNLNKQTCNGDSGGPALMNINGVVTIVGVTSFGRQFCVGREGGFDTRVDAQLGFLQKFVQ
jgi:secreted trypsin-like serine protease